MSPRTLIAILVMWGAWQLLLMAITFTALRWL